MCSVKFSHKTSWLPVLAGCLLLAWPFSQGWCGDSRALSLDPENKDDLLRIQNRLQENWRQAQAATVAIDDRGTGVLVTPEGHILTASHIFRRPGQEVEVTLGDGRKAKGRTLGIFYFADAGMVKLEEDEGPWPFVPMASPDSTHAGDWCFAVGHPGGLQDDRGPVLRLGRVIAARAFLRSDCPLIGGDSGGPLFNLNGELIGIHSRVSADIENNYHAPVRAFLEHWETLEAGETIPASMGRGGGYLGVHTIAHRRGLIVEEVMENTSAETAELQPGDIITHIDGWPVEFPDEFGMAIRSKKPGEEISLRLRRRSDTKTVQITLGKR